MKKFSEGFNEKFSFFLKCYRTGLLTFCGEDVQVSFNKDGIDSKTGFRMYDDGQFNKGKKIESKHSNILRAVIIGKKSWGLWLNQWTDGIVDWTFTIEEIFQEFESRNITIPESFRNDFLNRLAQKKTKRDLEYYKELVNET